MGDERQTPEMLADTTPPGPFFRLRISQWLLRRNGVNAHSLLPQSSLGAAGNLSAPTNKPVDNAASRNAQNCTFEVF